MVYSITRTTIGSRLRRSLAAYSRDRQDPSERTWSTGSLGAVLPHLARHTNSAPVAPAVRHNSKPTNNRSASSSTPAKAPSPPPPHSPPARGRSPVASEPHHPHLRERAGAFPPPALGPPERSLVSGGVGHVQGGPIHRHQPPAPIPRALGVGGGKRQSSLGEQRPQRLRPQPGAGLDQRGLHRQPQRGGVAAPARPAQRLHQ